MGRATATRQVAPKHGPTGMPVAQVRLNVLEANVIGSVVQQMVIAPAGWS